MKQLQLDLNKRLLIVEYDHENFLRPADVMQELNRWDLEFLCKGSELTEDIAKGFLHQSIHTGLFANTYCYKTALEAFNAVIYAYGYYWGENPVKYPDKNNPRYYDEPFDGKGFYQEIYSSDIVDWKKAESRTFNPSKCIIFEIL